MKCLIIAAGRGSRLEQTGLSKPLVPVLGKPLIERVIRTNIKAGVREFCVVTGFNGERVREFLNALAQDCHIEITHVTNEEWDRGNGLSVLKARDYLDDNFILMMGDHLVDPELIRDLMGKKIPEGEIVLLVDRNIQNPLIDMGDVTKVQIIDGKVINIGKDLKSFNGFDTGVFLCTREIFNGISQSISKRGDSTLTGGVFWLAEKGKVNVLDTEGRYWIDVDDPAALQKAENLLLHNLKGKKSDGPVSTYLNRPVSIKLSRYLVRRSITPNQVSLVSFVLSLCGAFLFMLSGYPALLAGGILAQAASIIDGCDGEIARLKFQQTSYGGWLDAVLDRYSDAFLLFGLTWHAYASRPQARTLFAGFMAIIGSFMVSYTADKYDALMRSRAGQGLRMGRDIRVFIIFIGAMLNQPFAVLAIIAVIMNIETLRRLFVCRDG